MAVDYGEFLGKWVFECHDLNGSIPPGILWALDDRSRIVNLEGDVTDPTDARAQFLAYRGPEGGILLQCHDGGWANVRTSQMQDLENTWVEFVDNRADEFGKLDDDDHPGEYWFTFRDLPLWGGLSNMPSSLGPDLMMTIKQHTLADGVTEIKTSGKCQNGDFSRLSNRVLVDLRDADLSGADLQSATFSHALLEGVNLEHCNLKGVDFSYTDLTTVQMSIPPTLSKIGDPANKFVGTTLNIGQIRLALEGANMDMSQSTFADITDQDLQDLNASGASLPGIDLQHTNLSGARFDGTNLKGAHFGGVEANGARFDRTNLTGVHFTQAKLEACNFSGAICAEPGNDPAAEFDEAWLDQCDFSNAVLTNVSMDRVIARGAVFKDAVADGLDCHHGYFHKADFDGARMPGAAFDDACLIDCSFRSVHFEYSAGGRRSDFTDACLQGADFTGADLTGSDILNANLQREGGTFPVTLPDTGQQEVPYQPTQADDWTTDNTTVCPDGCDGPCGPDTWVAEEPPKEWSYD